MRLRNTSSLPQRGRIRGFSLLELVIVLILVGALAVFAAPKLTTTSSITLSATAAQLIGTIRQAQSLSMSQGQRYRVNFTASTYQITDMSGATTSLPPTAGTSMSIAPATMTYPALTSSYVAFDTHGVPYISAATALAATATVTLTSGTDTVSITIAPETGRVK